MTTFSRLSNINPIFPVLRLPLQLSDNLPLKSVTNYTSDQTLNINPKHPSARTQGFLLLALLDPAREPTMTLMTITTSASFLRAAIPIFLPSLTNSQEEEAGTSHRAAVDLMMVME